MPSSHWFDEVPVSTWHDRVVNNLACRLHANGREYDKPSLHLGSPYGGDLLGTTSQLFLAFTTRPTRRQLKSATVSQKRVVHEPQDQQGPVISSRPRSIKGYGIILTKVNPLAVLGAAVHDKVVGTAVGDPVVVNLYGGKVISRSAKQIRVGRMFDEMGKSRVVCVCVWCNMQLLLIEYLALRCKKL